MTSPIRYESIQEPLDTEEHELMDPDSWDWEYPIEGVTGREPTITMRFSRDEYMAFWRIANAQGLTTVEFIKQAALARLPQEAPR
jgi:hypothetical protein